MKLNAFKAGLSLGIVWAASLVLLTIMVASFHWGTKFSEVIASIYIGYGPTTRGCFIGIVWGFIDGFVFGFLIAWLYNMMVK